MEKSKIDRFIDAFRVAMYSEFEVNEDGVVPANNIGGGKMLELNQQVMIPQ